MPRTTIVPENRTITETERWPALKFSQKDERMRVACLERQVLPSGAQVLAPWYEYVHRLEKPKEQDGYALQKKVGRKNRDGTETFDMVWDVEWVGSPICLGAKAVLADKGLDPEHCPVCRAVQEHPDFPGLMPATVRYAMNVIHFSTRPGGWQLTAPFNAAILVWGFTEKRFCRLDDLNRKVAERGSFRTANGGERPWDLSDVDLLLGPCEDVGWQRFDIDVAEGSAMWRRSPETIEYIRQLWTGEGNRATDEQLQLACGRPVVNRGYLEEDIRMAVDGWTRALRGAGPAPAHDPFGMSFAGQPGQAAMQDGMGSLLNELGGSPPSSAQPAGTGVQPAVQPTVAPATGPEVQPVVTPSVQPSTVPAVQPTPSGPPAPASTAPGMELPPPPPTPQQAAAAAGQPGVAQFTPQGQAQQQYAPGQALQQAIAPELAQLQHQQMAAYRQAGYQGPLPGDPVGAQPQAASSQAQSAQSAQSAQPAASGADDLFNPAAPPAAPGPSEDFSQLMDF